jgi:hypothetical protein
VGYLSRESGLQSLLTATATRGGQGPAPGILRLPRNLDLMPGMPMWIAAKTLGCWRTCLR